MGAGADPLVTELLPQVAVDSNGNAVVVYEHGSEIWSNYYNATTSAWGTPTAIDSRAGSGAQIAPDRRRQERQLAGGVGAGSERVAQGHLHQHVDQRHDLERHLAAHKHHRLVAGAGHERRGAAVVAWSESMSNKWQAAAATRQATGSAWSSPPTVLRPGEDAGDQDPVVAVSGTGEGFVLWTQDDTAGYISIWMRQHTASGWQAATLFEGNELRTRIRRGSPPTRPGP